jgi:hypothetical protein
MNAEFKNHASDHDPCIIRISLPQSDTSIKYFSVFSSRFQNRLIWITGNEVLNKGFNMYRAESPGDSFVKINESLILPRGDEDKITFYRFNDKTGSRCTGEYIYKLEQVDIYGESIFYEPDFVLTKYNIK